jgi:hypothetical protein
MRELTLGEPRHSPRAPQQARRLSIALGVHYLTISRIVDTREHYPSST